ncbi:MAG: hypothetical protein KFF49_01430 [Bacteroidales bacterium]|nr:hypothetical protein [Bacteroidales bacterium]
MKTYFIKVFLILLSISYSTDLIFSQDMSFQKTFIIGGKIGMSYTSQKTVLPDRTYVNKTFKIPIESNIGYFITKNIAVGAKLNYKSEFEFYIEDNINIEKTNHYIILSPFARYYTKSLVFIELASGFGISKEIDTTPEQYKILYYNSTLGLGYSLFLNQNISIEPIINYSLDYISIKTESIDYVMEHSIFLILSLQIYLNFNENAN